MIAWIRTTTAVTALLAGVIALSPCAWAFSVDADALVNLSFEAPKSSGERQYLGLGGKDEFKLKEINADLLVIEVFSMYCPHCQAEAPTVNRLFTKLTKHPKLGTKAKFLGIGIGNTPYEVDVFRKRYRVPFPLIADPDFLLQEVAEERFQTPTFLVVKRIGPNRYDLAHVRVGKLGEPDEFLNKVTGL